MKLRFDKNSVRFRVRKSDLKVLSAQGFVKESVRFGVRTTFSYQLSIDENSDNLVASLSKNTLSVILPKKLAAQWANSNEVGIEYHFSTTATTTLLILIEKDFPCEHKEDNMEDTFFELAEKKEIC
jgi:hypothetical protein